MLGLGLSFIVEGLGMMRGDPLIAIGGGIITFLLLDNRRVPAMLVLLGYGIVVAFVQKPELLGELSQLSIRFRWPELTLGKISWQDLLAGFVTFGASPGSPDARQCHHRDVCGEQCPFSRSEGDGQDDQHRSRGHEPDQHLYRRGSHVPWGRRHGRPYPVWREDRRGIGDPGGDRSLYGPLSERLRFAPLSVFPPSHSGVILFFAGIELALVIKDIRLKRQNLFVLLVTAGTAMWNMGVAYLAGLLLYYGIQRRWIRI